jgi:hypothetical protein
MSSKPRQTVVPSAPPTPLVLVVGCPAEFVGTCREAGARLGVAVRECDVRSIRTAVGLSQPFAVIVTEDLYQFDPEAFDTVARQVPASLVRIDSKHAREENVRELLVNAVFESAAGRGSGVRPILG